MSIGSDVTYTPSEYGKGSFRLFTAVLVFGFFIMLSCTSILVSDNTDAAITDTFTDEGIKYKIVSDSEVNVIGCDRSGDLVIPSHVSYESKSYAVVSIEDPAFKGYTSLTSVIIPDSVKSIGGHAFEECTSLTSVTIPDSVTTIGDCAFKGCTSLTSVTIPDSVTTTGQYVFNKCTSLSSVTLGNHLKFISWAAFASCTSLTSVTVPDSATIIGSFAFEWCTSLTSVTIPDSVNTIKVGAFKECTSLTSIILPDSVKSIGNKVFSHCTSLTSVTIPDSVKSIDDYTFYSCTSLTKVMVGKGVKSVGEGAFEGCSELVDVFIHSASTVIEICEKTFKDCSKLQNIYVPVKKYDNYTNAEYWSSMKKCLKPAVEVPDTMSFVYNGHLQTCIEAIIGEYTVSGNKATDAGDYIATVTLESGCYWFDGTQGVKEIKWTIAKAVPTAADFDYKAPSDLKYDAAKKDATVTPKDSVKGMGKLTVRYSDNVNIGRCIVYAVVGEGENYTAGEIEVGSFEITEKNTGVYTALAVPLIFVVITLFAALMWRRS